MVNNHIYWKGEISAAHHLDLDYESKCKNVHGHNYIVEVWMYGELNENGMVMDFSKIKEAVMKYDHRDLNDFFAQPTAEILSIAIMEDLVAGNVSKARVRVWEDKDSYAEAER